MAEAQLAAVLTGIQAMLQQQQNATDQLAAQASAVEDRFTQGEINLQTVMTSMEARLGDTEKKLADALTALSGAMTGFKTGLEQRLAASDARLDAAVNQLTSALATAHPVPNPPGIDPGQAGATAPGAGSAQASAPAGQWDPWAQAAAAAAAGAAPQVGQPHGWSQWTAARLDGSTIRTKDFAHIPPFDGELSKFPDWADRVAAKLSRVHPRVAEVLAWAEKQPDTITQDRELDASTGDVDVRALSSAIFDVLLERNGPRLYDKRRNAGASRGLEYWRLLKRDFGMESTDAQMAKLSMFMKPAKCADIRVLGEALDRWEALGREIATPMGDEFRLIALRELVPKSLADLMMTQTALKTYPEAMMFVRRQVADQRHAIQVETVRQQGHAPMDLSALIAAIGLLRGDSGEWPTRTGSRQNRRRTSRGPSRRSGTAARARAKARARRASATIAARQGTWRGIAPQPPKAKGEPKGKGKSKGKGKPAHSLEEVDEDAYRGISIGCLRRRQPEDAPSSRRNGASAVEAGSAVEPSGAPARLPQSEVPPAPAKCCTFIGCLLKHSKAICPVRVAAPAETWSGHECIEALVDSGAGECVCGPQHFEAVSVRADPHRPGAGVEYVCADGATIPNLGEKLVPGITDDGEKFKVNFQVCDVDRPLIAVSKLAAAGYDVWFGDTHGAIVDTRTGRETPFIKKNGVYVLRIWAPCRPESSSAASSRQMPGGTRQ